MIIEFGLTDQAVTCAEPKRTARSKGAGPGTLLLWTLMISLIGAGCGRWPVQKRLSPPPDAGEIGTVRRVGVDPPPDYEYRIGVGDAIAVRFFFYPDFLDPNIPVPSDGIIQMPLLGEFKVTGLTERELNTELRQAYKDRLKFPDLTARVTRRVGDAVYLDGAVGRRRTISYDNRLTVVGALKAAGMPAEGAIHSVIVMRGLNSPQYTAFRVNALKILEGEERDIYLEPNDLVYVPTKFITDVNRFVAKYIDGVLGRHIAPAVIFPNAFPYKGEVDYNVEVTAPQVDQVIGPPDQQ